MQGRGGEKRGGGEGRGGVQGRGGEKRGEVRGREGGVQGREGGEGRGREGEEYRGGSAGEERERKGRGRGGKGKDGEEMDREEEGNMVRGPSTLKEGRAVPLTSAWEQYDAVFPLGCFGVRLHPLPHNDVTHNMQSRSNAQWLRMDTTSHHVYPLLHLILVLRSPDPSLSPYVAILDRTLQ